jgi:hypothetical protein
MKRKIADKLRHSTWMSRNCKYLLDAERPIAEPVTEPVPKPTDDVLPAVAAEVVTTTPAETPDESPELPWADEEHPDDEFTPEPTEPTLPSTPPPPKMPEVVPVPEMPAADKFVAPAPDSPLPAAVATADVSPLVRGRTEFMAAIDDDMERPTPADPSTKQEG